MVRYQEVIWFVSEQNIIIWINWKLIMNIIEIDSDIYMIFNILKRGNAIAGQIHWITRREFIHIT